MWYQQPENSGRLAGLVGDVDRFAHRHWGSTPLHRRDGHDHGVPVLTLGDVEQMLDGAVRIPAIRLVRDGQPRPAAEWTRPVRLGGVDLIDVADGPRVARAFRDGASIVLQGLHRTWPPLVGYARQLESEISHPVQVNAYLTPPRARGLAEHRDAHDVFVVQTVGTKRWWVDGLGEAVLRPNEVLYVPAGVAHRAESMDGVSLHLTVGVLRRTVRHVVERALRDLDELDRPLPLGFARHHVDVTSRSMEVGVRSAAAELLRQLDDGRLAARVVDTAPRRRSVDGELVAVEVATTIGPDSRVAWRADNVLEVTDTSVVVRADGRWLAVPAMAVEALCDLRDAGRRSVATLVGLDHESRLVLARRLVRERLVDVIDPIDGRPAS